MEPLLKYWRGSGSVSSTHAESSSTTTTTTTTTTTIVTAVNSDEESGEDDDNDDEGSFFDMEFALPCSEENRGIEENCYSDGEENGNDFEFGICSGSSGGGGEQLDPSDDLFFKGSLVSIDTSEQNNQKSLFLQKSANRLRILMLKLKKSKCNEGGLKTDTNGNGNQESLIKPPPPPPPPPPTGNKFFTVKFKVEEVPIISLFTRDGSSKSQKQIDREMGPVSDSTSKEFMMQKYLNKYVHVSRRYAEKLKFSEKQGNLQAGLKVVYKHLGKSRSAVAATAPVVAVTSRRCDDSLMDQQDGIQGAILHCKRSFNSSRDCSSLSVLARSVSDTTPPRKLPEKSLIGEV